MLTTEGLQANPETYSPPQAVASLWESSTNVPSIQFASPWRLDGDQEKVSPEETKPLWPAGVVTALGARGTMLVDTSDGCERSTGAGSNLIDIGNQLANTQSIGSSG
ncbi:MAG: hypothetical protein WAK13_07580 [Terriglobales bacterium]